jgi:hypothetical protein
MIRVQRYLYRVSMLHELGANVPIQSRCGASSLLSNSPTGNRITGRLLAEEHSTGALAPFRDSLGMQSMPAAWVVQVTRKAETMVRVSPQLVS